MSKLYLMRHGETEYNVDHRMQGISDSPLTENGVAQAQRAARWLAAHNIEPAYFVCSPLWRAGETLAVVMEGLGKADAPHASDDGLIEMSFGSYDGLHFWETPFYEGTQGQISGLEADEDLFVQFGGTSMDEVGQAMHDALVRAMRAAEGGDVLAVAHRRCIMYFLRRVRGYWEDVRSRTGNCSVLEFSYDETREEPFELLAYLDTQEDA